MTDLLTVEGLTVDFALPGATVHAVRDVDLTVGAGEVVALVGESGSGKSVTASAVLGLLPSTASVTSGSIRFRGTELVGLPEHRLNTFRGAGIGMIFQNPVTSLDPSFTVGTQLGDTARLHLGVSRRDAREVSATWLERVGILDADRVLAAYPHELSGGMRQRIMIALASLSGPSLLIADEPTTALDATVQKQILDLLLGLTTTREASQPDTAVLLITHDFGVVSYTSTKVAVMKSGEVVEVGATSRVLTAPEHPYTQSLIAAVPEIGDRRAGDVGERRLSGGRRSARPAPATAVTYAVPERGDVLLELAGVTKDFALGGLGTGRRRSSVRAVDDVSLQVHRGEVLGVIGESGSGKSTLARLAGGLVPLTAGTSTFDGVDVATAGAKELRTLRRRFQYVFQDASTALNPRVRVGDAIARPLVRLGKAADRREAEAQARRALDLVGLTAAQADRYPREFSGGQRQRVSIARAIALEPELLVLDEPTSALDVTTQATILNLLLDLKDELGLTYLFIGHNLAVIERLCDRIGVMRDGRLLETFEADDLASPARHDATRELLDSVLPVRRGAPLLTPAKDPS